MVGVVSNTHSLGVVEQPTMQFYVPLAQEGDEGKAGVAGTMEIRAQEGRAEVVAAQVDQLMRRMSRSGMQPWVETLADQLSPEMRPWRLGAALFSAAGLLALLVAAVGIYGTIAYTVSQRTQEMGVRIALGARGSSIIALVLKSSVAISAIGVVIGTGIAIWAGRFVEPLLYDTSPNDPLVLGGVASRAARRRGDGQPRSGDARETRGPDGGAARGVVRWTHSAGRTILAVTRTARNGNRATVLPVLTFLALVFSLSWGAWFAAGAIPAQGSPDVTVLTLLRGPLYLTGVFAPAICALALTARTGGHTAVWGLVRRIARWDVRPRWYVFAAGYTVAIKLTVAVILRLANGTWPKFGTESAAIIVFALVASTWVQAGEELGWRGYALPRLARPFGLGRASIILGAIWATWHLPLFFAPGADKLGQSFPVYFLGVTAVSVAMAWLYWKTGGSLLLVMLLHAAYNNTKDIVPSAATAERVEPVHADCEAGRMDDGGPDVGVRRVLSVQDARRQRRRDYRYSSISASSALLPGHSSSYGSSHSGCATVRFSACMSCPCSSM